MTTRARIIELATAGIPPRTIAAMTGAPVYAIYTMLRDARDEGFPIPKFQGGGRQARTGQQLRFIIDPEAARRLLEQAERRGITPSDLARRLLTAIAADDLVGAVLDDETEKHHA